MPTIPHYNFDIDDLVGMDYLTLAKKKMLKDINTDKTIENADKYLNEVSFKDTGDSSTTINYFKEIDKLWKKSYSLLSEISSKITKPVDVNSAGADGNTYLIRNEPTISAEIIDKSNIINTNLNEMINYLRYIIDNPSTINKISKNDFDKLFAFFKKWILLFLGNSNVRWTGVATSQVLRVILNRATERYTRNIGNDRLIRRTGKQPGFIDVETICNNFEEMLNNWFNFRDLWRVFNRIYNAEPV